mmetsp:Transcript_1559/g.2138  ORF Transcript_1559/g.2138 Transcript_1559/m.2138 type:complete len:775 (+) Transcript_1559:188-2512(+)
MSNGTIPYYECIGKVSQQLFGPPAFYDASIPPLDSLASLIAIEVSNIAIGDLEISNYGVGGGSLVTSQISVQTHWLDARLAWDPVKLGGCDEIELPVASNIWLPTTVDEGISMDYVTITSNGMVSRNLTLFDQEAPCTNDRDAVVFYGKSCAFTYKTGKSLGSQHLQAQVRDVHGISVENRMAIPGYRVSEESMLQKTKENNFAVMLYLDPSKSHCAVCGGIPNTTLRGDIIPTSETIEPGELWNLIKNIFGLNSTNWTCREYEDVLTKIPLVLAEYEDDFSKYLGIQTCHLTMTYLADACCDGMPSQSICEANIHDSVITYSLGENTITPPEPLWYYRDQRMRGRGHDEKIDVHFDFSFMHIIDIDMQSNTLSALVSMNIWWYDPRLSWGAFIGGCKKATFRANTDAELTEIWVPSVDLKNKVQGFDGFPIAHASVNSDGKVNWKRSGVIEVACDVEGVDAFPFDLVRCQMDFGANADPIFHRFHLRPGALYYSDRLSAQNNEFQEYQIVKSRSNVTYESLVDEAYVDHFLRYSFYFDRATSYYMWNFISLYILYTLVSFGSFFLGADFGTRTGLGTAVLFVIAAQDITMLDRTPVSSKQLWIYDFSFGCKVFVLIGILQCLAIIMISHFGYKYYREENVVNSSEAEPLNEPEIWTEPPDSEVEQHVSKKKRSGWNPGWNKTSFLQKVDSLTALVVFILFIIFVLWMLLYGINNINESQRCDNCYCGTDFENAKTLGIKCSSNGFYDCYQESQNYTVTNRNVSELFCYKGIEG